MIATNHLGSPVQVVDVNSGVVTQKIKYNVWGELISDTNPGFQPFGFAGCLYDQDTKLCRFGVRDYDPSIGRWLSKDPILFSGGDTNLYGYVLQDPINHIDPPGTGPISGAICFAADIGYNMGTGVADFYNYTQQAGIYDQQIRNIQNQMNNTQSCDPNMGQLKSQVASLELQKNAALAQASNALMGGFGASAAGALVCGGLLRLPGF